MLCETVPQPKYVGHVLDQINTDNSANDYDTPKYVVDVLGRVVSKTNRRLPESRNRRHVITCLYCGLKLSPRRQLEVFVQRFDNCR